MYITVFSPEEIEKAKNGKHTLTLYLKENGKTTKVSEKINPDCFDYEVESFLTNTKTNQTDTIIGDITFEFTGMYADFLKKNGYDIPESYGPQHWRHMLGLLEKVEIK